MRRLAAGVAVLAALAAGCGGSSAAPSDVESLPSVGAFAQAFDAERGTARLVLLLSPT